MNTDMEIIMQEGYDAFKNGINDNPYPKGKDKKWWDQGWLNAFAGVDPKKVSKLTTEQADTISELRNQVYSAEDLIDGYYSVGMFGDDFKDIDDLHAETLELLRKYDKLLENTRRICTYRFIIPI